MSMTSLSPGVIFGEVGLHRTPTPAGVNASPEEIQEILSRHEYGEGLDWPTDSPLAGSYDARNSSTRLILINNKMPKSAKHLRSQGASSPERAPPPDPDRHRLGLPQKNPEHHKICNDSSSPKYVRKRPMNRNQRPPCKPSDESAVDRTRHSNCQISSNPKWSSLECSKRKNVRVAARPRSAPICVQDNFYLQHPELRKGDKSYLWSVAKVYSSANMKILKQVQYEKILLRQEMLGFHSIDEYKKYQRYLSNERKMNFANPNLSHTSCQRNRPSTAPDTYRRKRVKGDGQTESKQNKLVLKEEETADEKKFTETNPGNDKFTDSYSSSEKYETQNRSPGHQKKSHSSEDSEGKFPKGLESRERAKTARHRSRPKYDDSNRHQQMETDSKEDEKENIKARENSAKRRDDNSRPKTEERSKSAKSGERKKIANKNRPGTGKSKRSDEILQLRSSPYLEDLTRITPQDWRPPPPSARSSKLSTRGRRPGTSSRPEDGERPKTSAGERNNKPSVDEDDHKVKSDDEIDEKKPHDDAKKDEDVVHEDKSERKQKKKRYLSAEGTTRPRSRLGRPNRESHDQIKGMQETEKGYKIEGIAEEDLEIKDANEKDGEDINSSTTCKELKEDQPPSSTQDGDELPLSSPKDGVDDKPPSSTRDDGQHKKREVSRLPSPVTATDQEIGGSTPVEMLQEPTKKSEEKQSSKIKEEKDSGDVQYNKETAEHVEGEYSTKDKDETPVNTFIEEILKIDEEQETKDDSNTSHNVIAKEIQENNDTNARTREAEDNINADSKVNKDYKEGQVVEEGVKEETLKAVKSRKTETEEITDSDVDKEPVKEVQVMEEKVEIETQKVVKEQEAGNEKSVNAEVDKETVSEMHEEEVKVKTQNVSKIEKFDDTVNERDKSNAKEVDVSEYVVEDNIVETQKQEKSANRFKKRYIANTEIIESEEIETPGGCKLIGFSARIKSYQQAKDILDEMKADIVNRDTDRVPYACRYPTSNDVSEHFDSHGVHGAGLELLRLLVEKNVSNAVVFVIVRRGSEDSKSESEVRHVLACANDVYEALPF